MRACGDRGAFRPGGVSQVSVDLVPGGQSRVIVTSEAELPEQAVAAALDEAGEYRLAAA